MPKTAPPPPPLWPPRGSRHFGDYSIRDFAAKFLMQCDDFADIERYRDANRRVRETADPGCSIVLIGDSITEFWPVAGLPDLDGVRLINRGIAGQNSSVLLLRFQADVIELEPAAVVILAGTNDLRAYVGDPDALTDGALERLARNLTAMANMAEGRGTGVGLCTLPPVGGDLSAVARSPAAIRSVNAWIARFAAGRGYPLIDYHAVLADDDGHFSPPCTEDGIHPTVAGYARMAPLLAAGLAALRPAPTYSEPSS